MRWLRYVLATLTAAIIAVGILLPLATHLAPVIGGEVFAVRGGSMEPTIPTGSLILVAQRDPAELVGGEVITWRGDNGVWVTHRIVQIVEDGGLRHFRTRGDANEAPDGALVPQHAVIGSVELSIPVAGYAMFLLTTPTGIISWLSFAGALLLAEGLLVTDSAARSPEPPRARPTRPARLLPRRRPVPPRWPVHFIGVTILGDDPVLIADMVRCSEGDHRSCRTDAGPRAGVTGVREWAKAA